MRAGTECVAHMVQVLTSLGDRATILSVHGVGAYDSISHNAMFQGVADMVDGEKIIPFIASSTTVLHSFCGRTRWEKSAR